MPDTDFRIRNNARLVHFDKGFGASLRRLRLKLACGDFGDVPAGTIEENVERPQGETLRVICGTLGVGEDDIETY